MKFFINLTALVPKLDDDWEMLLDSVNDNLPSNIIRMRIITGGFETAIENNVGTKVPFGLFAYLPKQRCWVYNADKALQTLFVVWDMSSFLSLAQSYVFADLLYRILANDKDLNMQIKKGKALSSIIVDTVMKSGMADDIYAKYKKDVQSNANLFPPVFWAWASQISGKTILPVELSDPDNKEIYETEVSLTRFVEAIFGGTTSATFSPSLIKRGNLLAKLFSKIHTALTMYDANPDKVINKLYSSSSILGISSNVIEQAERVGIADSFYQSMRSIYADHDSTSAMLVASVQKVKGVKALTPVESLCLYTACWAERGDIKPVGHLGGRGGLGSRSGSLEGMVRTRHSKSIKDFEAAVATNYAASLVELDDPNSKIFTAEDYEVFGIPKAEIASSIKSEMENAVNSLEYESIRNMHNVLFSDKNASKLANKAWGSIVDKVMGACDPRALTRLQNRIKLVNLGLLALNKLKGK